jgi:hypothetical protein
LLPDLCFFAESGEVKPVSIALLVLPKSGCWGVAEAVRGSMRGVGGGEREREREKEREKKEREREKRKRDFYEERVLASFWDSLFWDSLWDLLSLLSVALAMRWLSLLSVSLAVKRFSSLVVMRLLREMRNGSRILMPVVLALVRWCVVLKKTSNLPES